MSNLSLIILIIAAVISTGKTVYADDIYYVHTDHINTPTVVTDQSKSVVWKADRDPFGKTTEVISTIDMPIRFPGQYFDEESGLHYNLMRDYDSRLGRYVQSDPIGLLGGISTYGYAYQNPVMNSDPSGELVQIGAMAAFGLVNGIISAVATASSKCSQGSDIGDAFITGFAIGAIGGGVANVARVGNGLRGLLSGEVTNRTTTGIVLGIIAGSGAGALSGAADVIGGGSCECN